MQIRLAMSNDLPAVANVVNAAFAIETFLEGKRTNERKLTEMLPKGDFLIAENEAGRIVASIHVERHDEHGYFGMLAVDPVWQGYGIGGALIAAAETFCRDMGCRQMDLTVLSLRPDLLPFYRAHGYVDVGTEEFKPSRPLREGLACHSIVMSKKL